MKKTLLILCLLAYGPLHAQLPQIATTLWPGKNGGYPVALTSFNGKLHFSAYDSAHGFELYSYNGSNGQRLTDLFANDSSGAYWGGNVNNFRYNFCVFKNKLFFSGNNGTKGFELFSYDGTNTPKLEADIEAGAESSYPAHFITDGSKLYFIAYTKTNAYELYSFTMARIPR